MSTCLCTLSTERFPPPSELLEQLVEERCHNPSHPGHHIATTCERRSLSIPDAAEQFSIECANLTTVIKQQAPVTPILALRMEAAG